MGLFERLDPLVRGGSGFGGVVAYVEALDEQVAQRGVKGLPGRGQRGVAVWNSAGSAMGEVSVRNSLFELRRVTGRGIYACEGVDAFHQQLVYDDRESEHIVVLCAVYGVETVSLQLGGGIFGLTDRASVYLSVASVEHLERVGIYEGYRARFGGERVGLVDVSDDVALSMAYLNYPCEVSGGCDLVLVSEVRGRATALNGRVILDDRPAGHAPHKETERRAGHGWIEKKLLGPGDGYVALFAGRNARRIVNHQPELGLNIRGGGMIYLGGMVGM